MLRRRSLQMARFVRNVLSMGTDFYRTLLVICLYGLGHINEVRGWQMVWYSLLQARLQVLNRGPWLVWFSMWMLTQDNTLACVGFDVDAYTRQN